MTLTYENIVRGALLLLLIIGSLTDKTVSPTITLLSFVAFEYMVRKLEKPMPSKDHSKELEELQAKFNKIDEEFKTMKGDIGLATLGASFRRK